MIFKYTEIIDISWPITSNMTAYKDQSTVQVIATKTFERDHHRASLITMSSHTGTHIDAPSHFLGNGKTIEKINISSLIGSCKVLDFTDCNEKITNNEFQKFSIEKNDIILVKTKNSKRSPTDLFDHNFVYLDQQAAQWLVDCKIKAFGIDYLGIERHNPGHETHTTLLKNDICIIEGLRLDHVSPGSYTLCCLPLLINDCDGAPARAVLLK